MTDAEFAAITEALHEAAANLQATGPDEPGSSETQRVAIERLGVAVELLAGAVFRIGKRR